jgi:hypothetical protein
MDEDYKDDKGGGNSKALIPEEFQEKAHTLVDSCENIEQCEYIYTCCSKKRSELNKAEMAKDKGKNPKTMGEFSTAEMPD